MTAETATAEARPATGWVTDTLWDPDEDLVPSGLSALVEYLSALVGVVLVLVWRRPDAVTNPQFWAEDGSVFFQENLKLGCLHALHTSFRGFPYLGQKLLACAATPLPLLRIPLAYTIAAYVIAGASLASFVLPGFRHVIRSDVARATFVLAVAALPQANELIGSVTNIGWYLGLWLFLLTIMILPRSWPRLVALGLAMLLATVSTPLVILTAPVWFARGLNALRRRRWREAAFASVALAGVLGVLGWASDLGPDPGQSPPVAQSFLASVSLLVLAHTALGPPAVADLVHRFGPAFVPVITLALLTMLTVLAWRGRWRSLPVLLWCAYGVVGSTLLPLLAHPALARMAESVERLVGWGVLFPWRYQVLAVSLVYLAFLASADRLPAARSRAIAMLTLLAWLFATQAATFVLPPFHDLDWPGYAARLQHKLSERTLEPLNIPINPDPAAYAFSVALDVRSNAPEVTVPDETRLGPVLSTTTYEQRFVARCPRLSEVDFFFGKRGRPAESIDFRLHEEASGRVVAAVRLDAERIISSIEAPVTRMKRFVRQQGIPISRDSARVLRSYHPIQRIYFPPIHDSEDTRYVITVTASGSTAADAFDLWGSTTDTYKDGGTSLNGEPLPGDVAFRYGCTRP